MKKVRIIVIDDDPLSLLIAKKLLRKYLPSDFNYMLEAFQDSKEAFSQVLKCDSDPDISDSDAWITTVLLDINMPGVDGWTFLDMLDEADPESMISVFLHSSSDNESDKDRAKNFGRVCNYITKPLDPSKISVLYSNLVEIAQK